MDCRSKCQLPNFLRKHEIFDKNRLAVRDTFGNHHRQGRQVYRINVVNPPIGWARSMKEFKYFIVNVSANAIVVL